MKAAIIPAKRFPVSASAQGVPQMGGTLLGWEQQIEFGLVTKTQKDHQIVESIETVTAAGTVQPLSATALSLKPEGERAWNWLMIHCSPNLQLVTDDTIAYAGTRYRVMRRWNYALYGYMQYEIVEDYRGPLQLPAPAQ